MVVTAAARGTVCSESSGGPVDSRKLVSRYNVRIDAVAENGKECDLGDRRFFKQGWLNGCNELYVS